MSTTYPDNHQRDLAEWCRANQNPEDRGDWDPDPVVDVTEGDAVLDHALTGYWNAPDGSVAPEMITEPADYAGPFDRDDDDYDAPATMPHFAVDPPVTDTRGGDDYDGEPATRAWAANTVLQQIPSLEKAGRILGGLDFDQDRQQAANVMELLEGVSICVEAGAGAVPGPAGGRRGAGDGGSGVKRIRVFEESSPRRLADAVNAFFARSDVLIEHVGDLQVCLVAVNDVAESWYALRVVYLDLPGEDAS